MVNQAEYLKKSRFIPPERVSGFPDVGQQMGESNGRSLLAQSDGYIGERFVEQLIPQVDSGQYRFGLSQVSQAVTGPGNGRAARPQEGEAFQGIG